MNFADAVLKIVKMFNSKSSRENRASTKTILIVEDAPHIQRLCQVNLQRAGYNVLVAVTGTEALTLVKTHRPDLVIFDMILPDMNGFEFLARLKEDEHGRTLPVIGLTLTPQDSNYWSENEGTWNGLGFWLIKPFHPLELLKQVKILFILASDDSPSVRICLG